MALEPGLCLVSPPAGRGTTIKCVTPVAYNLLPFSLRLFGMKPEWVLILTLPLRSYGNLGVLSDPFFGQ